MFKHHLYKVLQVRNNAPSAMIQEAYLRRMRLLTEMDCKTPEDDRRHMLDMAKINMAYDVLIDDKKRAAYDKAIEAKNNERQIERQKDSEENYDAIDWRARFHELEDKHYDLVDTFELREELLLFLSTNHLRPDILKRSVEINAEIEINQTYKIDDVPPPKPETFLDFIRGREWRKRDYFAMIFLIFLMVKGFFSFF